MKKLYFLFFLVFSNVLLAQSPIDKGLNSINQQSAKAYIGFLASDALEGRGAGQHGGQIALEYLVSYLTDLGIKPLGDTYFQPFEAYGRDPHKKGHYQVNKDSIALYKEGVHTRLYLNNILGVIEGENSNEYVVVGAHYDHLGMDKNLDGDKIYNGADDNASGVSAVMQIARAFVKSGVKPKRSIIFAFWDGEEIGTLGSEYFTTNWSNIAQVKGYLNFDMIGRNHDETKPNYVVYFYTKGYPVFETWQRDHIRKYKFDLAPDYRAWENPVGGSDNGSFAKVNIPIIWYHTDGHPDYHTPRDEASKINYPKVEVITKSAFLNLWNLANEKSYK